MMHSRSKTQKVLIILALALIALLIAGYAGAVTAFLGDSPR